MKKVSLTFVTPFVCANGLGIRRNSRRQKESSVGSWLSPILLTCASSFTGSCVPFRYTSPSCFRGSAMHVIPLPMHIAADAVAGEIIFGVGCAGGRAWDCVGP
jgi:hypothetical protein